MAETLAVDASVPMQEEAPKSPPCTPPSPPPPELVEALRRSSFANKFGISSNTLSCILRAFIRSSLYEKPSLTDKELDALVNDYVGKMATASDYGDIDFNQLALVKEITERNSRKRSPSPLHAAIDAEAEKRKQFLDKLVPEVLPLNLTKEAACS